jgi:arsenate reductase
MVTLYHYAQCSKSRAVHEILVESGVPFETIDYLQNPPTAEMLNQLLWQLGMEPSELVRTGEDEYDTLGLKHSSPRSREEWLAILVAHPILMERPIVTNGLSSVLGRPPEKVKAWLAGPGREMR